MIISIVIQSIKNNLPNHIALQVQLSSLVKLSSVVDTEIKAIARIILDDLSKLKEKFETKMIMS